MDPIEAIAEFLASHYVRFTRTEDGSLTVPSSSEVGFDVSISGESDDFVVHFDGWHEHLTDPTFATKCFLIGLTSQIRLVTTYRGGVAFKWAVKHLVDDAWQEDTTVETIFQPFWKKAVVKELQNSHLTFDQIKEFSHQRNSTS